MLSPARSLVLLLAAIATQAPGAATAALVARDGTTPSLPFDPNTTSHCTWWIDLEDSTTCSALVSENGITLDQFRRWNPSVPSSCGTLQSGRSYCVEAFTEPTTTSTTKATTTSKSSTTTKSSTTPPPATTTKPSNGITTPVPTQPNLVDNCNAFYLVQTGDTCSSIVASRGITLAQFLAWNPSAGSTCTGLWANAYACVSVIGGGGPSPTTTTTPGNGVATPLPTQTGMVTNCNKFHFVQTGQTCATVAALYSLSTTQFVQWNPAVKSDCSGLWASTYACVGIIGGTPAPTTTSKGNGVATPTPTQPGMVGNCKKFALVSSGDTCQVLADRYKISLDQFVSWNTGVGGKGCTGLWANVYVCIGV